MNLDGNSCACLPATNNAPRAAQIKRPRAMPGPFKGEKTRSVATAAEVEAVDQLAANGLDVLLCVLGANEATRHDGSQRRRQQPSAEQRVLGPVARVAILGLPEQARDEVEAVF